MSKYLSPEKRQLRIERARLWNLAHPERVAARQERNKQKIREQARAALERRREADPDKLRKDARAATARYLSRNPWANSFYSARARCTKPSNPRYKRYGGRGIKFLLTLADVRYLWNRDGASLMECASIDRIDNDGDYALSNCRYIERSENSRKRREDRRVAILKNYAAAFRAVAVVRESVADLPTPRRYT